MLIGAPNVSRSVRNGARTGIKKVGDYATNAGHHDRSRCRPTRPNDGVLVDIVAYTQQPAHEPVCTGQRVGNNPTTSRVNVPSNSSRAEFTKLDCTQEGCVEEATA